MIDLVFGVFGVAILLMTVGLPVVTSILDQRRRMR